jgi:hypothetical protein
MFEVENDIPARTIRCQISGAVSEAELREAVEAMRRATDAYGGSEHMVLADLRGLAPLSPAGAALMGASIAYQRQRGVVFCAHLADSSIIRLQAKRVSREVSPDDRITVDVISLDEAEKALSERRPSLGRRR